ncbi:hypothetical protein C0995_004369 [Termitomyces sp. Mi166|nr:hypothetical protein C0995_004369 [Termitomyces sp. Mi166\
MESEGPGTQPTGHSWQDRKPSTEEMALNALCEIDEQSSAKGKWMQAASLAVQSARKLPGHAQTLHDYVRKFINGWEVPMNQYGTWIKSKIDEDDELVNNIKLHLQQCGKYVSAHNIVEFLNQPEVKFKHGIKLVSEATAKWSMKKLEYYWVKIHKGQYVDGHEHDVVDYHWTIFLPKWYSVKG